MKLFFLYVGKFIDKSIKSVIKWSQHCQTMLDPRDFPLRWAHCTIPLPNLTGSTKTQPTIPKYGIRTKIMQDPANLEPNRNQP